MPELLVDGQRVRVPGDATVLTALLQGGALTLRRSVGGEPRSALCGMGTCLECRALVDGKLVRTCLTPALDGMRVERLDRGEP